MRYGDELARYEMHLVRNTKAKPEIIKFRVKQKFIELQTKDKLTLCNRDINGCVSENVMSKQEQIEGLEAECASIGNFNQKLSGSRSRKLGVIDPDDLERYRSRRNGTCSIVPKRQPLVVTPCGCKKKAT